MSKPDLVYLDHNATTPVAPEILAKLPSFAQAWGNPSSIHAGGRDPKQILRETRRDLAAHLNCSPLELVFTSGGSESNNTVLKAVWNKIGSKRNHFISSAVEHPTLMKTMEWLEEQGARVDYIPVDRRGRLDVEKYRALLCEETALVSVMAANNETGTLFPIRELADLAHGAGALFHTDAVQMLGKMPLDLKALNVDYASFSAHKVYAL
ncbi:MAG TPA: aminotransferase class V-fold PLP-dependent enzyme, partial [Pseudobdellovibrionaceae bacterium]|nr:aminotransferase class V-fold PLP-dependent enzyme [Pseudobdellovibrionaceae bacterium]